MKLDILNVLDWLDCCKIEYSSNIGAKSILVDKVRWKSNDDTSVETLFVNRNPGSSPDTIVDFEKGSFCVLNKDADSVFHELLKMFRFFSGLELRALQASFFESSLTEIANVASTLFSSNVLIIGEDNTLLASTMDNVDLDQILNKDAVCFDFSFNDTNEAEEALVGDKYEIISSLWYDENKVGKLIIDDYNGKMHEGTIHLVRWITDLTENLIRLHPKNYNYSTSFTQQLHSLLIHNSDNIEDVSHSLSESDWQSADRYVFAVISGYEDTEDMDRFISLLHELRIEFRSLYFENMLIILGNTYKTPDFEKTIRHMAGNFDKDLKLSLSYPFYGWNNLLRFFNQAKQLNDSTKTDGMTMISPEAIVFEKIKSVVSDKKALSCLSNSDLLKLKKYDKDTNSDLFGSLETYLLCGCRVDMASEIIGIHPNSLRYRIHKIETLLSKNLSDYDERRKLIYSLLLP